MALGCLLAANAWQTAGWTAQKKRWIWPWGSSCTAQKKRWIWRLGVPKRILMLNVQAWTPITKPLMWPWGACWLRTPGKRQAGPPRRSDGSGLWGSSCTVQKKRWIWPWDSLCLRGWAFRTALASFNGFKRFRRFRRFKRLGAGKRQAWTPIRSH